MEKNLPGAFSFESVCKNSTLCVDKPDKDLKKKKFKSFYPSSSAIIKYNCLTSMCDAFTANSVESKEIQSYVELSRLKNWNKNANEGYKK